MSDFMGAEFSAVEARLEILGTHFLYMGYEASSSLILRGDAPGVYKYPYQNS